MAAYLLFRSGFQPEEIPVAMFVQRLVGVMAHWRESMCTYFNSLSRNTLTRHTIKVRRIKLFRPTHIYTGETEPVADMKVPAKL